MHPLQKYNRNYKYLIIVFPISISQPTSLYHHNDRRYCNSEKSCTYSRLFYSLYERPLTSAVRLARSVLTAIQERRRRPGSPRLSPVTFALSRGDERPAVWLESRLDAAKVVRDQLSGHIWPRSFAQDARERLPARTHATAALVTFPSVVKWLSNISCSPKIALCIVEMHTLVLKKNVYNAKPNVCILSPDPWTNTTFCFAMTKVASLRSIQCW